MNQTKNNIIPFPNKNGFPNLETLTNEELAETYKDSLKIKEWCLEVEEAVQNRILSEKKDIIPEMKLVIKSKAPRKWNPRKIKEIEQLIGVNCLYEQRRLSPGDIEKLVVDNVLTINQLELVKPYMIPFGNNKYAIVDAKDKKRSVLGSDDFIPLPKKKARSKAKTKVKKEPASLINQPTEEDYVF